MFSRRQWAVGSAIVVLALSALVLADSGFGEPGVRRVVRWTARSSLVLFSAALAGPALSAAGWLARNRHGLLAALASSHALHGAAIGVLAILTGGRNLEERASPLIVVGGLLGYVAIGWAALRPDHRLTGPGLVWVWGVFAFSYLPRALRSPVPYLLPLAMLALVMLALIVGRLRSRVPTVAAAGSA